ncbi:hypothetical protein Pmani_002637 [Petrolisthes manimaculis]|uniref:Uncharacterized protein n=1 Tax=Petrolisthes manimaculis TaxID=1843537 RepID=A0AAE1UK65_9EUCA|nr:hypothetical protein Pmani_002637 [Petrolisthes manimaculis]
MVVVFTRCGHGSEYRGTVVIVIVEKMVRLRGDRGSSALWCNDHGSRKCYLRSDRSSGGLMGGSSSSSRSSRFRRYSGALTTTALDRMSSPHAHTTPEMSYTARKYSSTFTPSSGTSRRSASREKDTCVGGVRRLSEDRLSSGRLSSDRLSSGRSMEDYRFSNGSGRVSEDRVSGGGRMSQDRMSGYGGRCGSSDRHTSSGYSSRRGSANSDLLHSSSTSSTIIPPPPPPPPPPTSSTYTPSKRYSSSSSSSLSGSRNSSTTSRMENGGSGEVGGESSGGYSRSNSTADLSSGSSTPRAASSTSGYGSVSGYATVERRHSRRKREYMTTGERRSVERTASTDISPSYSSLDRRSKYGRTYSCDLPSCRTTPVKDYTKELYTRYSNTSSSSMTSPTTSTTNHNNNNTVEGSERDGKQEWLSEGPGARKDVERDRSPSVRFIHEGLARISQELERHRHSLRDQSDDDSSSSHTSGSSRVPPPPPPPPPPPTKRVRETQETRSMKAAIAARGPTRGMAPRTRVNKFAPLTENINVERQINLAPEVVIPVSK